MVSDLYTDTLNYTHNGGKFVIYPGLSALNFVLVYAFKLSNLAVRKFEKAKFI